uniref:Uncharacterized protein n=1 Tax=Panagrellus redivivus TaxID=6233 RepID=A0A7E4UN70_PANRE
MESKPLEGRCALLVMRKKGKGTTKTDSIAQGFWHHQPRPHLGWMAGGRLIEREKLPTRSGRSRFLRGSRNRRFGEGRFRDDNDDTTRRWLDTTSSSVGGSLPSLKRVSIIISPRAPGRPVVTR